MRLTGVASPRSSRILASIERLTAMRRSIRGVRARSTARSSGERIRLEWTVPITQGRLWPASARASAARVPTSSARYMWLWTTSGRASTKWAARAPTAMASSGSSTTSTGMPRRRMARRLLPWERATTLTS